MPILDYPLSFECHASLTFFILNLCAKMAYNCVQYVFIDRMFLFIVKRKQTFYVYVILGHEYLNVFMTGGNKKSERWRRTLSFYKVVGYKDD